MFCRKTCIQQILSPHMYLHQGLQSMVCMLPNHHQVSCTKSSFLSFVHESNFIEKLLCCWQLSIIKIHLFSPAKILASDFLASCQYQNIRIHLDRARNILRSAL